jgi:allantoate deiminase
MFREAAGLAIERCRTLARLSEEEGATTRTFLSPPMRKVHALFREWTEAAGMQVRVDAAGNIRAMRGAEEAGAPRLYIGSHLDTVPNAGAFDGVLGVAIAVGLMELVRERRFPFAIEVAGFSEEEGVRFTVPFVGSRALAGEINEALLAARDSNGVTLAEAIRDFGLDPTELPDAVAEENALGYLEFHIEQGPVLESLGLPLGIVETIVGQSRMQVKFTGAANHAGTTPMKLRRDALAGAAEWIGMVEREACATEGLVATTGQLTVEPGAGNVIAGTAQVSLDVRHASDAARHTAVERLVQQAGEIASRRRLSLSTHLKLDQPAVDMDGELTNLLERAAISSGHAAHRMNSGAGHDAMILARRMPVAMLFVRSPGGISHHPDESVLEDDAAAAFSVGLAFLDRLEASRV